MNNSKVVLSLQAHPDDAEFTCAGTLALLRRAGWEVHIATMTAGDCGTTELGPDEIRRVRVAEAARAADLVDGTYHCLECDDVFILYDRPTILKAIGLLREVRPMLVFAPSPSDYMVDHEITATIAQSACFAAGMKNIEIEGVESYEPVPYLYYVDPYEGKDRFGAEIKPGLYVNIGEVIETKKEMLACHASQRNWLLKHHGVDEYIRAMISFAEVRGEMVGHKHAEGFRQHLGHGFSEDNILKSELGELVRFST
ncbi:PIG-L deacetylase family protein [candidate division KSB1 bacterium]